MKKHERVMVCPVCGSTHLRIPQMTSDILTSSVGGTNYMVCEECGSEVIPIYVDKDKLDEFRIWIKSKNLSVNESKRKTYAFSNQSSRALLLVEIIAGIILMFFLLLYKNYLLAAWLIIIIILVLFFDKYSHQLSKERKWL
ncbi:hypothetical protein J7J90_03335 [Candidatus Micrarchaeota archaeon]|nr:hypothetical protein [Candidatus Micrarchaeota archaeon]